MLKFTDSNNVLHLVNIENINNVVIREQGQLNVFAFHMNNQPVLPITVDRPTAERLIEEIGAFNECFLATN
jgi:hypothetical protein